MRIRADPDPKHWLEHPISEAEVLGSNPASPIMILGGSRVLVQYRTKLKRIERANFTSGRKKIPFHL